MDLGHDRGVHQPRHVEQPVIVPIGMARFQPVTDRVVLVREQRVQHRQAHPPVADETGRFHSVRGAGKRVVVGEPELAADAAA